MALESSGLVCESLCNPVQEAIYCLPVGVEAPTSPGSAFNSRDHRQRMNRSEPDKRASEGLKVHKAFPLGSFPGTDGTFEQDRDRMRVQRWSDTEKG